MRKSFNRANLTKNEQDWKPHVDLHKYSVLITVQKKGWEDYCEEIESGQTRRVVRSNDKARCARTDLIVLKNHP